MLTSTDLKHTAQVATLGFKRLNHVRTENKRNTQNLQIKCFSKKFKQRC